MQDIRTTIEARTEFLSAGDAAAAVAYYAPGASRFTLAPPLAQTDDARDVLPLEQWMASFEAPPQRTITQLEITTDGDVAFASSIDSMTFTPKGAPASMTLWYRTTLGLRRVDGNWLITHEHSSVPFHMDGSLRAAVDLVPPSASSRQG